MAKHVKFAAVVLCMLFSSVSYGFEHFITRQGSQLFDGETPFRFFGIHAPELHRIEDDARGKCEADRRNWGQYFKLPTRDEQENWIKALSLTGHKAMRIYVLSVAHPDDDACGRPVHILPPKKSGGMPVLNETAMVVYDQMIALAEENQLRLILPFIDHWDWWGGRKQLAAFYGETADDFYDVKSKTFQAYHQIIRQVITRKNTITGRYYYDEKAIMAWETGNELKGSTQAFVASTARLIKQLAPHQLVVDGNYTAITPGSLNNDDIDIVSNHFYTNVGNNSPDTVYRDLAAIGGKKAYLVGEYGLVPIEKMRTIADALVTTSVDGHKAVGGFVWGFRGHRHNGGFYWHHEGNSGYKSYHLPGFAEAHANQELQVTALVRHTQARMDGKDYAAPLAPPSAPVLRAVDKCGEIAFMGAPLGRAYRIERKAKEGDVWEVVTPNFSDGIVDFNPAETPLFIDVSTPGLTGAFLYRVIAVNESGESPPSNTLTWHAGQCEKAAL